jgi:hypothetical protein
MKKFSGGNMNKKTRKIQAAMFNDGLSLILSGSDWVRAYDQVRSCMLGMGELCKEFYHLNNIELATLVDPEGNITARALYNPAEKTMARAYGECHWLLSDILSERGYRPGSLFFGTILVPRDYVTVSVFSHYKTVMTKNVIDNQLATLPVGAYNIRSKYRAGHFEYTSNLTGEEGAPYYLVKSDISFDFDYTVQVNKLVKVQSGKFDSIWLDDYADRVGNCCVTYVIVARDNDDDSYYDRQYFDAKY